MKKLFIEISDDAFYEIQLLKQIPSRYYLEVTDAIINGAIIDDTHTKEERLRYIIENIESSTTLIEDATKYINQLLLELDGIRKQL